MTRVRLEDAIGCHKKGMLSEAEALYRDLLTTQPHNPEPLHGLGVLLHQTGRPALGANLIGQAIDLKAHEARYHNSLGNALHTLGELTAAINSYLAAIEHDPAYADAIINLANIFTSQQKFQSAIPLYERAMQCLPADRGLVTLLGTAYLENGENEKALHTFGHALQMEPEHCLSHFFLAHAILRNGDFAGSIPAFQEAIRIDPTCHEAHNALGAAYDGLGDYTRAAASFAVAHSLRPHSVEYLVNIGLNLTRRGENGGSAYLDKAITLAPGHVDAHMTLAEVLLASGNYTRGWSEYEWRWRKPEFLIRARSFYQPMWNGDPLHGRVILLHAEQGYGDTIQFARFIADVVRLEGVVLLEVQPALYSLLRHLPGIRRCLRQGVDSLPTFHVHCPLMSLPRLLGIEEDSLPPPVNLSSPTLYPSTSSSTGLPIRIGLAWSGNPRHPRDSFRSIPLQALLPLTQVPELAFVSLQKDLRKDDENTVSHFPMERPLYRDFLDTKKVISGLHLIVSVDTAVAHLAASMGKPVWLLLPQAADWRWGVSGETSPWYPSLRIFRQTDVGRQSELIARLVGELIQLTQPLSCSPLAAD